MPSNAKFWTRRLVGLRGRFGRLLRFGGRGRRLSLHRAAEGDRQVVHPDRLFLALAAIAVEGHGIEAAVPYGVMLHGEAIALGIRAALFLSERLAGFEPAATAGILSLLGRFHLPLVLPPSIATATIMEKLARDKKFAAGAIRFVVLDAPGSARVSESINREDLIDAIGHLRSSC